MTAASLVRRLDRWIAPACLALGAERPALVSFLFHTLFRDEAEIRLGHVDPNQRTTVAYLDAFVGHVLAAGYRFVTPQEVAAGLEPGGRYALLTFDDGYYNNALALPVLRRHAVPAVFFISTGHVLTGRNFWWDVLYRERLARAGRGPTAAEIGGLKRLRADEIEDRLIAEFGAAAFRPRSDVDRPFTPDELCQFARDPLVHLGNHTRDHAILTNYPPDAARAQVQAAQDDLERMTGVRPTTIAYPNGDYSDDVVRACQAAGLTLGITIDSRKARLPVSPGTADALRLPRFTPDGAVSPRAEARACRCGVQLYETLRGRFGRRGRRHSERS